MTYAASTVAYWVGQANDNSTGSHPTGWTSGQRWSETANEWSVMYTSEYGVARDTSTGTHPTGWTNGQLWSETASEWQAMYNTEYTAARDNSAGQTGRPSGLQHPTGWTAGQLWSETATEWNAMWVTEWNNSHDPQGYAHSYPGQAANAVYWSQSAGYWRGQADYYWGPSRIWNNGITWEQDRNNWYNQAQSWYNSRYTDGYNAGYSAGLPRGLTETIFNVGNVGGNDNWQNTGGASAVQNPFGFTVSGNSIYCQKAGTYAIRFRGNLYGGNWGWGGGIRMLLNGNEWVRRDGTLYGGASFDAAEWATLAVGHYITTQCRSHGAGVYGQGQFTGGEVRFWFVPTPSVPS